MRKNKNIQGGLSGLPEINEICATLTFFILIMLASIHLNWQGITPVNSGQILPISWGAGVPDLRPVNSILSGHLHTQLYSPQPFVVGDDADHALPFSRVERSTLHWDGEIATVRGVVYDYFIAAMVVLRSGLGGSIIYDFNFIRDAQGTLLFLVALLLCALISGAGDASPKIKQRATFFLSFCIFIIWIPENKIRFTNGIIDSSLAPSFLIIYLIFSFLSLRTGSILYYLTAGLIGSSLILVRGEYVMPLMAGGMALLFLNRKDRVGNALSMAALTLLPIINGIINYYDIGVFIPIRSQSGQNLLEPIGQFSNPWGIIYDDIWFGRYIMNKYGAAYASYMADVVASREYFNDLIEAPSFFLESWLSRVHDRFHIIKSEVIVSSIWVSYLALRYCKFGDRCELVKLWPFLFSICSILIFCFFNSLGRMYEGADFVVMVSAIVGISTLIVDIIEFFCGLAIRLASPLR